MASRKSWTPTSILMLGACTAGIIVAIAHHLFYNYLDGRPVGKDLPQVWVINIATTLTFLCKTLLVLAVTTAFTQCGWFAIRHKPIKVKEVDVYCQLLSNPLELFRLMIWPKVPFACLLAVVAWLIPVAAVFPPGTISVSFPKSVRQSQENVAMPDFANSTKYATTIGSVANHAFSDASSAVYKGALSAGTSGEVVSIPHEYVNTTYSIQFYGPAIQCGNADSELNTTAATFLNTTGDGSFLWVAFVGGDDHGLFDTSAACENPGVSDPPAYCYRPLNGSLLENTTFETLDVTSNDTARLYVWTWQMSGQGLLQCELYNASYSVDFDFTNNLQSTNVTQIEYKNEVAANNTEISCPGFDLTQCSNVGPEFTTTLSYQAVMKAFNTLFVGALFGSTAQSTSRLQTLVQMTPLAPDYDIEAPFDTQVAPNLEQLFQKVTLSMLGYPDLRADAASTKPVQANIISYDAVYRYRPLHLWLAYGLSILFTVIGVLAGFLAQAKNGASFSNKFSSYARLATLARLQDSINADDDGADPCPPDLGQIKLSLDDDEKNSGSVYQQATSTVISYRRPTFIEHI